MVAGVCGIPIASACLAVVFAATISAANADCRTIAFHIHPPQDETISTTGVSTGGSACTHRFWSGSGLRFTSGAIVSRPSHGTLSEIGALQFRYAPHRGFTGVDQYSVRVCGRGGSGSGCSIIAYAITVQ
jgi:hypothetical protein